MEWTWRTATESNMPNSPKLPSSVQEVSHEVSEPNPMGNAEINMTLSDQLSSAKRFIVVCRLLFWRFTV